MPNGVSFTLAASVLCLVYFTNGFQCDGQGFVGGWTLNVNSTGAKTVRSYTAKASTKPEYTYTTLSSTSAYIGWLGPRNMLIMYDGTYWITINSNLSKFYSDYSD